MEQTQQEPSAIDKLLDDMLPKFEVYTMPLRFKGGFVGFGSGWDKNAMAQIGKLGGEGFQLVSVIQGDPNNFLLFFQRQIQ